MRVPRVSTALSLLTALNAVAASGCIAFVDPDQGCASDADCADGLRCDPGLRACVGGSTAGTIAASATAGTTGSGSGTGASSSTTGSGSSGGASSSTSTSGSSGSSGGGDSGGFTCQQDADCVLVQPCHTPLCDPASHTCSYPASLDDVDCGSGHVCSAGVCVCPNGSTDCGGSCIDLQTDANNCGVCGSACGSEIPCRNGACKSFFGAFEISSPCGSNSSRCAFGNPELGGARCDCPDSGAISKVHDDNLLTDIDGGIGPEPLGVIGVCGAAPSDFGGMYTTGPACGGDCIAGNPFAATPCDCPAGYIKITLPAAHACPTCSEPLQPSPGSIVLCWKPQAEVVSFGGAFEIDDPGAGCRVVNPATAGCSCASGTSPHPIRVIDAFSDGGWVGATISICSVP